MRGEHLAANVLGLALWLASCSGGGARDAGLQDEARFARAHATAEARGQWVFVDGSRSYLALPVGRPPLAGALVLHTARGLTRDIQLWTDRIAEDGYAAVAVDFYGGRVAVGQEEAIALRDAASEHHEENLATARRAYDFLAQDPRIRARRRALVGFSYGGGWATLLASKWPDVNAVVAYYGTADVEPERIATLTAPTLLVCGRADDAAAGVSAFEAALRAHGNTVHALWNDEDHNFADPSHPRYAPRAAAEAYAEVRRFLRSTLTAPPVD